MKKKTLLIITTTILSFLLYAIKADTVIENKISESKKQSVQIKIVNKESFIKEIVTFSRLKASKVVNIRSQARENLKIILIDKGQYVKKGEVIATLDMGDLNTQMDYLIIKKEELLIEEKAIKLLNKKNQTTPLNIAKTKSNIAKIISDIESINTQIEKRKIISPINGIIDEINFEVGEVVETSKVFTKVIGVINKVEAQIHSNKIDNLKENQKVVFNHHGKKINGYISYISKTVSNKNNTIKIEAKLNENSKYENQSGQLSIKTKAVDVMKISASSIILGDNNKMSIFHIIKNKAILSKIEVIKNDGNEVWIKPITDNSIKLVIVGQFYLKNNIDVEIGESFL
jgi:multidrug efflux pump subunit AcrA (membrane-fusion protein)